MAVLFLTERWSVKKKRRLGLGSAIIASLLLSSCANTGYIRESSVSSNKPIRNYSLVSKYILPTPAKKVINVPLTLYLPDPVSLDSKLSKKRIKNPVYHHAVW